MNCGWTSPALTVNANLQFTPNNIITFDGSDRFAGNNPAAVQHL